MNKKGQTMKRLTQLTIAIAMLLPLVAVAQTTTTRTVTWTAPVVVPGVTTAAVSYIFQWRTVGAAGWTTATGAITSPSFTLDIPTGTAVECRVAGIDAQGHQGPWSPTSDPYTYATPGACSKPVWQ